jgi:hypothetical protein
MPAMTARAWVASNKEKRVLPGHENSLEDSTAWLDHLRNRHCGVTRFAGATVISGEHASSAWYD